MDTKTKKRLADELIDLITGRYSSDYKEKMLPGVAEAVKALIALDVVVCKDEDKKEVTCGQCSCK